MHPKLIKFFLRRDQRIAIQFSTLNENANLPGSILLGFTNRLNDPIMLDFAKELSRPHFLPTRSCASTTEAAASAAESTETTATASGRPASSATGGQKYWASSARRIAVAAESSHHLGNDD